MMTAAEHKWDFNLPADNPYIAIMGELGGCSGLID